MDTVNKNNIANIEFPAMMTLLECKNADIEEGDDLHKIILYYANRYDHLIDLWGMMYNEVKTMKLASANKVAIGDAMAKRDYLKKKASGAKIKYYAAIELSKGK